jgi:hypothetical protein
MLSQFANHKPGSITSCLRLTHIGSFFACNAKHNACANFISPTYGGISETDDTACDLFAYQIA